MLFCSHEHGVLSELLWSLTVRRCPSVQLPSVHNLLVNTIASTNINQSSLNLVKMYMTTRARMTSIMEPIGPELSKLSSLEFENLSYLTVYSLASTNINQSSLNLVKMYMTTRARMSSIMEPIGPELSKLSALEFENLPYLTMFTLYHLQILTNQYQTWPQYICP